MIQVISYAYPKGPFRPRVEYRKLFDFDRHQVPDRAIAAVE